MQSRQSRVQLATRRTQGFLDDNATLLASVNKSVARQKLDTVAADFLVLAADQGASARTSKGETAKARELAITLRREFMRPIAEIARDNLKEVPEFKALGPARWNLSGPRLTADARAMADAAAQHAAVFVAHGLSEQFVAELRAAADALDQALDKRNESRRVRAGATRALVAVEQRGRRILRVLDALVRPKLAGDARLLGEWDVVKRVPSRGSGPVAVVQQTAAPAAPVPIQEASQAAA